MLIEAWFVITGAILQEFVRQGFKISKAGINQSSRDHYHFNAFLGLVFWISIVIGLRLVLWPLFGIKSDEYP